MTWKILRRFLSYLKGYWKKEVLLLLLMLISSLGGLASPYILKIIIDQAFPSHNYQLLVQVLVVLTGIYVVRIAAAFWSDYLYSWVSTHIVMDIRQDLFRRFIHMPMQYYLKNKTGDIVYRIHNEVDSIQYILTNSMLRLLNNVLTIIGLIVALCWLNYKLFLLSALVFPLIFFSLFYFTPRIRKTVEKWRKNESDLLGYFSECFQNIRLVKSFNAQAHEEKRLFKKSYLLTETTLENTIFVSLNRNVLTFFIALGPVIVLWWGGREVLLSGMTTGTLVAFMQYLMRLYSPATDMFSLHSDMVRASVSMKRIAEVLDYPSHIEEYEERKQLVPGVVQEVSLEHVYFQYDDVAVLEDVSLKLEAGKKYALVGESGCGKSTVTDLICQFYKPGAGSITVNGRPMEEMNPYSWMDKVAVVNQESYLFHDGILENIKYGRNEIERDEEADEVMAKVGVNLQNENSKSLSGGQKQRIGIARALLKKAEVFILDESTSAMDSIGEREIFGNIKEFFEGKMLLLISHRVSSIMAMEVDEVICMRKGRIVERGGFEELCRRRGYFWELFRGQLEVMGERVEI
ncbi:ABC transporter ATP-binding protein [Chitinophaga sancti]|uniref:ABC transporter ATP-binding protein n=1 Tax=Chitinophaga sancti TaxID=1004 RepID=UPI002A754441|nr:ABC transporter ATP-binding protein [Chitinophaga sancti]WPQ65534.1 ABC transporter ATP-binding protein [Chitinophaga sancti]